MRHNMLGFLMGVALANEAAQHDENDLGKGFRLEPVDYKRYENDSSQYYNLFKDGKKISDKIFRRGGISSGFKKGDYCSLIVYGDDKIGVGGTHCIVDMQGKIVHKQSKGLSYPYLAGGVIVSDDNWYYNLLNGEKLVRGRESVSSKDFIFVESSFYSEDGDWQEGVYQIEKKTGKVKIFKK